MDATMDSHAGERVWQSMNNGQIDTIGFTKLDIASQYGALYNLSLLSGRPVSFVYRWVIGAGRYTSALS